MQFLLNAFDCLVISFFLYLLVSLRDRRRRAGLSYPPGPPSWPVIGNILDFPKETPWTAYTDMSKKYGRHNQSRAHGFAPAEANVPRRCHLSSCLFSGHHRVVFIIIDEGPPGEARPNLFRKASLANHRNVRSKVLISQSVTKLTTFGLKYGHGLAHIYDRND
jgi:hypothetical protein